MKKFLAQIGVFLLPVLIFSLWVGFFYVVSYQVGEFKEFDQLIELQRKDETVLLGAGYNEQTSYYKKENANYYQADVIALGTSRAMQFKKFYFEDSFYNCGGAVAGNYNEYKNFLENLSYTPKMILLDLDVWVFNDAWNRECGDYGTYVEIAQVNRTKGAMLKDIIKDYFAGKWKLGALSSYPRNVGYNGKTKDNGFMYDGSYYEGNIYRYPEKQPDYQFADTKKRIANGNARFEYGEHIDPDTLYQLENLLKYCRERDIYVIAYMAPLAPTVYEKMEESGQYGYMKEIAPACLPLFEEYGYEYYDFTDGAVLDITDAYFIDGFHGSEVAYALMVREMIKKDSRIAECIDIEGLEDMLQKAYSSMVFENPDTRRVK